MDIKVRELRAKDVKALAKMLGKLKPASVEGIFRALDNPGSNPMQVGLSLFHVIAADLTDDIYAWLADLIGKTPAELDEMSASTPIDIIKELTSRGEFKDFFGSATQQAGQAAGTTTLSKPGTDGQMQK
jgi:hypothetical protein